MAVSDKKPNTFVRVNMVYLLFYCPQMLNVSEQQCEGPNEHYSTCGTVCQANCTNYEEPVPCILLCSFGCFCNDGYVRESDNSSPCIKIEDCPQ
ncbi:hypothetical protein LAZ67_16002718 [Cordylochernes scorpioides]|uniref:TIL domain-containing protein n=1 Tax=Cordylochernes scorpioides TaxID=51811 RepID=A0ABY6LC71_9ARAC|nr:hypothetical protein LAZ67_16002718 [Cordylochernes scorpioides]